MKKIYKKLCVLCSFFFPCISFAASPWLPPPGRLDLSLGLSQQKYDALWQGTKKTGLPGTVTMDYEYINYVYGITENLATDLQTGYSQTRYTVGTRGNLGGLLDTSVGLLYRSLDENKTKNKYLPTITFRMAGTLKGKYGLANTGNLQAPGDKVDGSQISILVGKNLPHRFAIYGELGYRYRGSVVPNAYFGNIGILQTPIEHWTWGLSYENYHANSGIDIGKPPFTGQIGRFGFQATKEQSGFISGSLMYSFPCGQSISAIYGQTIHGRNTAVSKIISLFVTIPLQLNIGK